MSETRAKTTPIASLDAEQRSSLAWALVETKLRQGEGLKETLLWSIRNGAHLLDDLEFRTWFADALEGKLDPERGRGRPRKKQCWDMVRAATEHGIGEAYRRWLSAFQRDRDLAWLRFEALRLHEEQPDAAVWRRAFDLGTEAERRSYAAALADLGARPCPPAQRGAETARDFALRATVEEYRHRWMKVAGKPLTSSVVGRILTRAKKSE